MSNGNNVSLGHCRLLQLKSAWILWKWHGYCRVVSSRFRVFDVTCVALLVKEGTFQKKKKKKKKKKKEKEKKKNY